jgi:hypothetical protein
LIHIRSITKIRQVAEVLITCLPPIDNPNHPHHCEKNNNDPFDKPVETTPKFGAATTSRIATATTMGIFG